MPNQYPSEESDYLDWLESRANKGKAQADYLRRQPTFGPWIPTTLLNGYTAPDPPMIAVQYRLDIKTDSLEFTGHIDTGTAVSGSVAFVMLQPFWPAYDISFLTDISDGATFQIARCFIDSTNGEVSLIWPAV